MEKMIRSFGRTELAQRYFPGLTPDGAWHKLRAWLHLNPRLSHFYDLRRRTFTPAEVQLIYAELGGSRRNNHFSDILRILFQSKSHLSL